MTGDRPPSRILRNVLEPIAGSVFFSREAQTAYERLGFRPHAKPSGLSAPDQPSYIMARAACLGEAPPSVVGSAFAVFERGLITGIVEEWRPKVSARDLQTARCDGAVAQIRRILPDADERFITVVDPLRRAVEALAYEGRPLFAGLLDLGFTGDPVYDVWHAADLYREHRGDSNIMSWSAAGLSAVEACLLNDLNQRLGLKSYVRTRGWTDAVLDDAVDRLRASGLLNGDELGTEGHALRESIEVATDRQQQPAVEALGDELGRVRDVLAPVREQIMDGDGYPGRRVISQVTSWT